MKKTIKNRCEIFTMNKENIKVINEFMKDKNITGIETLAINPQYVVVYWKE